MAEGDIHEVVHYTNLVGIVIPSLSTPTSSDYIKHAQQYGTLGIMETAEEHLPTSELMLLERELTRIEKDEASKRARPITKSRKRKRVSKQQKMRAALMYHKQDVPASRIAAHLGVTKAYVYELIREARAAGVPQEPDGDDVAAQES